MAINKVTGDLIRLAKEGQFDFILHGCNCFCTMGAGIAKQIAYHFPGAVRMDYATEKGDIRKLGNYSIAYENIPYRGPLGIVNLYTQFQPGANFDLAALDVALTKLVYNIPSNSRIGLPRIGAGIGAGNWIAISKVIKKHLDRFDTTIVTYELEPKPDFGRSKIIRNSNGT